MRTSPTPATSPSQRVRRFNIYEYRTFTQSSGTLTINGSLNLNGDTFYDDGGANAGAVTLSSDSNEGELVFGSIPATGGTFNLIGTTTATNNYYGAEIEGNAIPTGIIVNIAPVATIVGNMEVSLPSTFTNAGTLNLLATGQNHNILIEGSTLNNTGTININPGPTADGQRELELTLNNSGTLNINASTSIQFGKLTNSGKITIGHSSTFEVTNLLTNTGLIDIGSGTLKLDEGLAGGTILAQINAAYDHGAWDGASGIGSSLAATHPGTGVGYTHSGNAYTLMYTWLGDTDLSGTVTSSDLMAMAPVGTTNATWANGDFNYDGKVNADDYALFMLGAAESGGANISMTLPEPAGSLLLLPAISLLVRKRR